MHTPGTVSHRTGHTEINTMILRKATIDDAMDILTWRNDPLTRVASFNKEEIDPDSHMNWFRKKLGDENCELFILADGDEKLGHIRVDIDGDTGTISYMINPVHRGKGYGRDIIKLLDGSVSKRVSVLSAFVEKNNIASMKCFEHNGYERSENEDAINYTKQLP